MVIAAAAAAAEPVEVAIENGAVVGETSVLRFTEGERVRVRWTADEAAELHLHGYDVHVEVEPGEARVLELDAIATGRFPVTLHGDGDETVLLYIEVYPR